MFEWMSSNPSTLIHFDCVDIDAKAIKYARRLNNVHLHRVSFYHQNALRFNLKQNYDLIWSAGLFDYFEDKVFVHLLRRLLKGVKPNGEVIIGNFAEGNPSQGYMEIVGDWHLRHRSAKHLLALAYQCGVPTERARVGQEPQGVNLFLHVHVQA